MGKNLEVSAPYINTNESKVSHEEKQIKKKLYDPFYGWVSTASRLKPLQGGSLLFTTKFAEVPGTHFSNMRRMKG